jgi:hypothetical protein
LPLLYTFRRQGIRAAYSHRVLVNAVEDFCNILPGGADDYRRAIRRFATELYTRAAPNVRYFVDKTPRYHLVLSELMSAFPEGHVIVLWRNPLDVAASIIETWGEGRWNLHRYEVDLHEGLENLTRMTRAHPERTLRIRYEELVTAPEVTTRRALAYLNLDWDDRVLNQFADVPLKGRLGEPEQAQNRSIRSDSIDRWMSTFSNSLRRRWCRRYLDRLGKKNLEWMGYDPARLEQQMRTLPSLQRFLFSDTLRRACAAGLGLARGAYELTEDEW